MPTERRVKYDCALQQFVITVREVRNCVSGFCSQQPQQQTICVLFFQRLVANKHDSDDGGAQASSSDDGVTSDYDVVNTSDESDENDDTRRMRELFNAEAAPDRETRMMRECRFCGKKKSKRTLLVTKHSF